MNKHRDDLGYAPKHETYRPIKNYSATESPLKQWWLKQQEEKEKQNVG